MSELFREIEEDIKQEKFEKLWRSFGRVMVWTSVGLVAATVVFVLWQNNSQNAAEAKTAQFLRGIDRLELEDYKGAAPIFSALTNDESSHYYGLAMLRMAQAQDLSGDKDGAKATYAALAKHNSAKPNYVFAGIAQLKGDIADISPNSPFYYTISEYKAWQLLGKNGGQNADSDKKSEAIAIFAQLAVDSKAPHSIAERAQEVLRTLAPEKVALENAALEKSSDKSSEKQAGDE